ncbi:CG33289 [Drosophila busckii]|uniref:CG33289 n=1 Tax=Drosophila busckii TaxID=30019 RepID=A0A0M4EDL0_DROBS|nr:CG33289 [Drosophila busckii]
MSWRVNLFKVLRTKVKEFLRNTSLPGLKYVWDNSLPHWVQFYFGAVFVLSMFVAINQSLNVFNKWQSTPVIMGKSARLERIQNSPFPAITLCNMNKAKYSKVSDIKTGSLDYAMLQRTCYQKIDFTQYQNIKPRSKNDTFANFMVSVSPKCEEMIIWCQFGPTQRPCTDIFREFFVDEGLCCVFNLLHPYYLYKHDASYVRDYTTSKGITEIAVDWNPMTGYPKSLPAAYYPRRSIGVGVSNGLQLVLNGNISDYYCSSTNGQGFKVLLYNSIDQPHMKESGLPSMLGHETNYRIVPRSYSAISSIRSIARSKRQCIFSDEQELLFYRYYTRRNCEAECDALYFHRLCNCIPHHLPLIYRNASVCFVQHFACLARAEAQLVDGDTNACKELCLASCHDVSIFPDQFAIPFSQSGVGLRNKIFQNLSIDYIRENMAVVNFYYDNDFIHGYVRSSYTGPTEYMSLTGGIMSLMFGFSVVFIAELFYHLFLHSIFVYINYWWIRHRNRIQVGQDVQGN